MTLERASRYSLIRNLLNKGCSYQVTRVWQDFLLVSFRENRDERNDNGGQVGEEEQPANQ